MNMRLNVLQAKQQVGVVVPFRFDIAGQDLDLGDAVPWRGMVAVEGGLVDTGRYLEVAGSIRADGDFECGRCLESMCMAVTADFAERFVADGTTPNQADGDVGFYSGEELDITELVRETLLLAEPLTPVCSQECLGLCPQCGLNLNKDCCSCDRGAVDSRLAVLSTLLKADK